MGRVSVRYKGPTSREWRAIATNPDLNTTLLAKGNRAKALGIAIGPQKSGHYKESFEVSIGVEKIAGYRRSVVTVANTSRYAATIELTQRVLRKVASLLVAE